MVSYYIPALSTYAGDIDFIIDLIFWLVGFWFILSEAVFFWLIFRFRKKEGVKAEYITGELAEHKRWITIPHFLVLFCDIFILYYAIAAWYEVKQNLPEPDATVRIIGQQWAWTFVHEGPDGKLGTADDITELNELHTEVGKLYNYKLESTDVMHSFSVPVFRLKQALQLQARIHGRDAQLFGAGLPAQAGCDSRPRDHRLVGSDRDRRVLDPVRGDLRHWPRLDGRANLH